MTPHTLIVTVTLTTKRRLLGGINGLLYYIYLCSTHWLGLKLSTMLL